MRVRYNVMTTKELILLTDKELDSRQLARPQIRKKAVRKVVEFMEKTGSFIERNELALPSDKKEVETGFLRYHPGTVYGLNGAINLIYQIANGNIIPNVSSSLSSKRAFQRYQKDTSPDFMDIRDAESSLVNGKFVSVNSLDNYSVPTNSGIYCIKLRKGVVLSTKYRKIREDGVIYIGKADNLHKRLWEEELNLRRPATFFRGIGAILDYLPPKGSLIGKSNQNNYVFSPEDTEAIKRWMRQSLLVNWIQLEQVMITDVEKRLIKKYQPLMNTTHNPNPSKELAAARKRCREYAVSR